MSDATRQFFDELSGDYTAAIERCAPRYREMLWAVLHYLPSEFQPARILELGCGSGNLSEVAARKWPQAELHMVDISGNLLQQCQERLGEAHRLKYVEADFSFLDLPPESFDLVISSIAIHHLSHGGKRRLLANIFRWLRSGGWLSFSDQMSAANADVSAKHNAGWKDAAFELGSTQEDWNRWMEHQTDHDHHATLVEHIDWLRAAGFGVIDCPWRYLLWTVMQTRK